MTGTATLVRGAAPAEAPVERRVPLVHAVVTALLVALVLRQEPGRLVFDTKLDLQVDPWAFMGRATSLWDPQGAFGELQNQAYGYLFPMGPFFAGGQALGLPAWLVERLWVASIVVVAYAGFVRLAARLGIGTTPARVAAGLAYAIGPRVVAELGPVSPIMQCAALLPWVLIPLVDGLRGANPRKSAARSGLAVLLMGGVNAVLVLALLPLPALLLWLGRAPRRLAAWWVLAVGLASIWWVVPLALLGRYSPPFLDWIETAAGTTTTTSPSDTLRGAEDWVPRLVIAGRPWLRAGFDVATQPWLVLAASVPVVLGLVGLLGRGIRTVPYREVLIAGLLLGIVIITLGHLDPVHAPWAGAAQGLLDGGLAPLRNLQKFDPLVRLPLLLGACHLLGTIRAPSLRQGMVLLLATATLVTATPMLTGRLYPEGSAAGIPSWWRQTADYLAQDAQGGRALLLPGSGFAEYGWGRTIDEPMQALARTPWAVRNVVPLSSAGNVRAMDAVEQVVADGRPSAGLSSYLERMGVTHVVLRNDLDWVRAGVVSPGVVRAVLQGSPGLVRVASFGPIVRPVGTGGAADVGHGLESGLRSVEVYLVGSGASSPRVATASLNGVVRLAGGPESVLAALDAGLLATTTPTVLAGQDRGLEASSPAIVTDGLRRVERDLGRSVEGTSQTLTGADPFRVDRRVHDRLPDGTAGHLTTARYVGVADVQASSSASDATALAYQSPSHQPFAAVDGDPSTEWLSGGPGGPVGQWLEVRFDAPIDPAGLKVALADNFLIGSRVRQVAVHTDVGTVTSPVSPGEQLQPVGVDPGPTRSLRLTVDATVDGKRQQGLAGIIDLAIPGVPVARTLVTSTPPTGGPADYLLTRVSGGRTACAMADGRATCDPGRPRQSEEASGLDRTITLAETETLSVSGWALPRPGRALDALLEPLDPVDVTATSTYVPDAVARPRAALDGDPGTAWIAGSGDADPRLDLRWDRPVVIDRLSLLQDSNLVASRPTSIQVSAPSGVRTARVGADGEARFAAISTDRLSLRFPTRDPVLVRDQATGEYATVPIGISELRVPALTYLLRTVDPRERTGAVCGFGPRLVVDGRQLPTEVSGTVADVLAGRPLRLVACRQEQVTLVPGEHRVQLVDSPSMSAQNLVLTTSEPAPAPEARDALVRSWGAEHRSVQVGPGQASVLVVHEDANPGWAATLDGRRLRPLRIDGWQQGWVLPAGAGGTVRLDYRPGIYLRLALGVGLLAALALVGLALVGGRRGRATPAVELGWPAPVVAALTLGCGLALAGVWGMVFLGAAALLAARSSRLAGLVVASGAVIAAVALALVAWRYGSSTHLRELADLATVAALGGVLGSGARLPTIRLVAKLTPRS